MLNGEVSIRAKVILSELVGGERMVYCTLNGSKCSVRVPLNYTYDKEIELKISIKDIYFFNSENGENVFYNKREN